MIDLKDLRDNPDRYRQAASAKGIDLDIDVLLDLDAEHRRLLTEQQEAAAEKNRIGQSIGQLAGQLKKADGQQQAQLKQQMAELQQRPARLKEREQQLADQVGRIGPRLNELLMRVPQPPDEDVPWGKDDSQNLELRRWGEVPRPDFEIKDHLALGEALGLIDVERGVKLAGTRSYFLTGAGTLLHQAVLRLAFDMMVYEQGFEPISVPVLVREPAMEGTGYFPLGREQTYRMSDEQPALFLVGTAEVSLTAYLMGEVLDADTLPRRYVAMSPCFRREAGTYGKDTAGLYRIHQFDKVEQVVVCRSEAAESRRWHEKILNNAEAVLQRLELPYRVVSVCSGDLGQGQASKYDLETWMPSRGSYGETHSASRFYDFQARRLNLRYRDPEDSRGKRTLYCHTLNNTVIASPRILIPLLEMYQNADGSVSVPRALRPYMNGRERIEK